MIFPYTQPKSCQHVISPTSVNKKVPSAGDTALIQACRENIDDVLRLLLEQRAYVHLQDNAGDRALLIAIRHGNTRMVEMLSEAGADIEGRDKDGATALIVAAT